MHKTDSDFEFKIQNGCFIFKHYYFDSKKTFWYLLPFYDFKTDLILKALQIKLIRSKTECVPGLYTRRGGGGGGGGGGGWNPTICTRLGLSAHSLCARDLPFSQSMYKPINGF